jgi:putative MATE family efflux protein
VPLRSPYDREIATLAVPALGTLIAEPLYLLADTAVVGHLGTDELAGLALASTVLLTVHALTIFLAYGTTSQVARLIGAGRTEDAAHRSVQALWLAAGLGTVGLVLLGITGPTLLRLLGGGGRVLEAGTLYLRISLLGLPFMLVLLAANGSFHGRQNTRIPLLLAITGAAMNLAIELVLIYGFGYGIGASALATLIAQATTAGVGLVLVITWARSHHARLDPDRGEMTDLMRFGGALVVRTAAIRGSFTLSVAIAGRMGAAEVASHQIALQLWGLLALALDSVAIAGQSITGRWLGRRDPVRARGAARRMIEIDVGLGVVLGLVVLVTRHPIAAVFTDDAVVVSTTASLFLAVALHQPVGGLVFALDGILIGAGDFSYLARSMVVSGAIFAALALSLRSAGFGLLWLWAALGVFMITRAVALWLRWRSSEWLRLGA